MRDIGAMLSGWWHDSHFCWKIGATSLVNVGVFGASAAVAGSAAATRPLNASAIETRNILGSFQPTSAVNRKTAGPKTGPASGNGHYRRGSRQGRCLGLSLLLDIGWPIARADVNIVCRVRDRRVLGEPRVR